MLKVASKCNLEKFFLALLQESIVGLDLHVWFYRDYGLSCNSALRNLSPEENLDCPSKLIEQILLKHSQIETGQIASKKFLSIMNRGS